MIKTDKKGLKDRLPPNVPLFPSTDFDCSFASTRVRQF